MSRRLARVVTGLLLVTATVLVTRWAVTAEREKSAVARVEKAGGYVGRDDRGRVVTVAVRAERLTDTGLRELNLPAFPHLSFLDLSRSSITDDGLKHIAASSDLTALDLSGCPHVGAAGFAHLVALPKLNRLALAGCPGVTADGLKQLAALGGLTELNLAVCPNVTDEGLNHLTTRSELTRLDLSNCPGVTGGGLACAARLPKLRTLILSRYHFTDEAFAALAGSGRVHVLEMAWSTNRDDRQPTSEDDVAELFLQYTRVTDAGLAHLKHLTGLKHIHLQHTRVTDAGLAHLKHLTELESVDLEHTQVTDAGLQQLTAHPSLRSVNLLRCGRVTPTGVAELRQALQRQAGTGREVHISWTPK